MLVLRLVLLMALAGLMAACGSKDPEEIAVQLTFNGDNPFQDPALADILFILTDTADPDAQLVFPSACANNNLAAGCGYTPSETEFRLDPDPIPMGATMTLEVRGRDADGLDLFSGVSAAFKNSASVGTIEIAVGP
jgi:hypothetical protein